MWKSGIGDFELRCAGLLQEESFTKLVPADERFRRTKLAEQVEDLAVLENAGVDSQRGGRKQFDGLRIHDSIAVESFGRAAVKKRQNGPSRMQERVEALHHAGHQLGIEIV